MKLDFLAPGFTEVGKFIGTHLISGMVPAFFIAGAIGVFLEKERITRLMGPKANPLVAYLVASFSGALLTVCSCGVLPIFTGILQRGAGIGPAFTFLFSSPAINLIAVTYTYTSFREVGAKMVVGRCVSVIFGAILIGALMRLIIGEPEAPEVKSVEFAEDVSDRSDGQTFCFFLFLVLVMITSVGILDSFVTKIPGMQAILVPAEGIARNAFQQVGKVIQSFGFLPLHPFSIAEGQLHAILGRIFVILLQIAFILLMLKKWFHKDEVKQWLKKSWSLFVMIFPKVLFGIFISGLLAAFLPLGKFMKWFADNSLAANLFTSLIGCTMYFGTIVGVNIVSTLHDMGMNQGPALTLLLAGPAISLPSVLALFPIVGGKKTLVFLSLVVVITTLSGFIFGMFS